MCRQKPELRACPSGHSPRLHDILLPHAGFRQLWAAWELFGPQLRLEAIRGKSTEHSTAPKECTTVANYSKECHRELRGIPSDDAGAEFQKLSPDLF